MVPLGYIWAIFSSDRRTGDGKVKVHNNGVFSNDTSNEICGFATVPNPDEPGLLLVEFPTSEPWPPGANAKIKFRLKDSKFFLAILALDACILNIVF
jgi:hypothetical protein